MKMEDFTQSVKRITKSLSSLTELLIDYNGVESLANVKLMIEAAELPTTLTCTIRSMEFLKSLPVKFNISLHSEDEIPDILANADKISSISVMTHDLGGFNLKPIEHIPTYFVYNKFSLPWSARNFSSLYLDTVKMTESFKEGTIDHCMLTRIVGQECPASTQLNFYRDGSFRRCPYMPEGTTFEEAMRETNFDGCKLIRSK